jgi:hypothetical protein
LKTAATGPRRSSRAGVLTSPKTLSSRLERLIYQAKADRGKMRIILLLFLLMAAMCEAALAQNPSINELRRLFDYNQNAPLDVKEVGVIIRSGVRIHDITYASPKSGRVTAYLVEPTVRGSFAGVVFGHGATAHERSFFQRQYYMHAPALFRFW